MTEEKRPKVNTAGQKELDRAVEQLECFKQEVEDLTAARNPSKVADVEPQTKLSQKEIDKKNDIYLKPHRTIGSKEKFDEKWRKDYEYSKEYVKFIAENREVIGEEIDVWSKPFPGVPAEEWKVPVNKPIWGPRYLAEQLKKCNYHRLTMQQGISVDGFSFGRPMGSDGIGTYTGGMIADTLIQRLDALPVSTRKSVFMGVND